MSLESNKVFAAVLSATLLIMVITTISETVFHKGETKPAFTIEVASADAGEAEVAEGPSLAELLAVADAGKGERQFAKCKACHTIGKDDGDRTGPNLFGIMGRQVAANSGFNYSGALSGSDQTWTWELMDAWLASPKNTFNGTSMAFAGIRKEGQRADLMAYLNSFSDSPLAVPAAEDAVEAVAAEVAGQ